MMGMSWHEYLRSKAEGPYKALQEAHDSQRLEDELVERVANRVMIMIDTGEAVGKIKELDNLIKNLGK